MERKGPTPDTCRNSTSILYDPAYIEVRARAQRREDTKITTSSILQYPSLREEPTYAHKDFFSSLFFR